MEEGVASGGRSHNDHGRVPLLSSLEGLLAVEGEGALVGKGGGAM